MNCTHRTWSGEPGRAARLHNPTPNHHMEHSLPAVSSRGRYVPPRSVQQQKMPSSQGYPTACTGEQQSQGQSGRFGCRVSGCRCSRRRRVSWVAGSPARGCSPWARCGGGGKTEGRGGFKTRVGRVMVCRTVAPGVCFFWGGEEDAAVDAGGGGVCGQQACLGAAKISLPTSPH